MQIAGRKLEDLMEAAFDFMATKLMTDYRLPSRTDLGKAFGLSKGQVGALTLAMRKAGLLGKGVQLGLVVADHVAFRKLLARELGVGDDPKSRGRSKSYDRLLASFSIR